SDGCVACSCFFFFSSRRRHTRSKRDWSSDVCSSDLHDINLAKNPPTVIMLVGLQGAGKTTLAGKLSKHLKQEGHTPMLVAADLRSEERRVGKEWGCRWSRRHEIQSSRATSGAAGCD